MSTSKIQELELRVLELLEEFEDKLEASPTVPLTGKILVDRQEFLSIIKDINMMLPDEYQQVRFIKSQKSQIIEEATQIADELVNNARHEELRIVETAKAQETEILINATNRAKELVNEHEIVRQARMKAQEILTDAEEKAEGIRTGSYDYAEDIMRRVEVNLSKILHTVRENIEELEEYK
jgi:vacuolar-type H+-ATPase subunit H